jgi:hypothetical protein
MYGGPENWDAGGPAMFKVCVGLGGKGASESMVGRAGDVEGPGHGLRQSSPYALPGG